MGALAFIIEIHKVWINQGRPGSGPIHLEKNQTRASYKAAIRAAQRMPKQKAWDKIHEAMEHSDTTEFWNSWKSLYSKNKNHFAPVVNGCSSKQSIAEEFKNSFLENSKPNNPSKVEEMNQKFHVQYREFCDNHASSCDCANYHVSVENVIDAICRMKKGKCADAQTSIMRPLS